MTLKHLGSSWGVVPLLLSVILSGCSSNNDGVQPSVTSDFESAAIGEVEYLGAQSWELYLADDNDNDALPDSYRNWWYVRFDDLDSNQVTEISLRNRGWQYYYVPVYSYDGEDWQHFEESQVSITEACDVGIEGCYLNISASFDEPTVYVARFYPYTYSQLQTYIASIEGDGLVSVETVGFSPDFGEPIQVITIENDDIPTMDKHYVWIHARSHPGETPASFMLEGIVEEVLANFRNGREIADELVFYINPMHNIDGVLVGNYRTNTFSQNLEIEWLIDTSEPLYLTGEAAMENRDLNFFMADIVTTQSSDNSIALNLHATNSDPETDAFAYAHFGLDPTLYTPSEIALFEKQDVFINDIIANYDGHFIEAWEGGSGFLESPFPETWWWYNVGEESLALTIEAVYSKGTFGYWVTDEDVRELGRAIAESIFQHYESLQ
ncbi:MAG: M14-type cytosolic carboxypeptidase [Pseudomonadota bacterium]